MKRSARRYSERSDWSSLLENGALSDSCSFLPYGSVAEISKIPHLPHMTDTIIDEYREIVE